MTQKPNVTQSTSTSSALPGGAPTASSRDESLTTFKAGVGDRAHEVVDQVKHAADDVAGQARHTAELQLSSGKDRVAQGLGSVAAALRKTGTQLREDDPMGITDYVVRTADQVEAASDYFQRRTLGEVVGDVEQFARREPALFLGGAFLTGLLGGRFLKSARRPVGGGARNGDHSEGSPGSPRGTRSFSPPREPSGRGEEWRRPNGGTEKSPSPTNPSPTTVSSARDTQTAVGIKPAGSSSSGPPQGSAVKSSSVPGGSTEKTPGNQAPGSATKAPGGA
jgi:hypothetical protein